MKGYTKLALAVFLVALVSLMTVAAPCASLHQRVHQDRCGSCETCPLCTMMHGTLDCAMPAPILDTFVAKFIGLTPAFNSAVAYQVDLRLSPSRAPPSV